VFSAEQLQQHVEAVKGDGYTIVENAIEPDFLESLVADLDRLNNALGVPPADALWGDESFDHHPTLAAARRAAATLLTQLPRPAARTEFGDTP